MPMGITVYETELPSEVPFFFVYERNVGDYVPYPLIKTKPRLGF